MTENLSPSELNVLEALRNGNLTFNGLKKTVKNRRGGSITDRGLSTALKKLQTLGLIERLPSREYHIRPTGEDYLIRRKLTRSMENEPVHYSKEIIFKVDLEPLYRTPEVAETHLFRSENYPLPIPVQVSSFGSEEIKFMTDRALSHHAGHDHADIEEFPDLILEEDARPLIPYLTETILDNCINIVRQHEEGIVKGKTRLDVFSALNFNWGLTVQFEGKRILDEIRRNPSSPLKKDVEERLVGLLLLYLLYTYMDGCEFVIPSMVRGGMLDKKEGEELQELYERIHGKTIRRQMKTRTGSHRIFVEVGTDRTKCAKGEEESKVRRRFLIKALGHLKKGNGLYIAKSGVHGIEGTGLTEDDVFNEIVKGIEKGLTGKRVVEKA